MHATLMALYTAMMMMMKVLTCQRVVVAAADVAMATALSCVELGHGTVLLPKSR